MIKKRNKLKAGMMEKGRFLGSSPPPHNLLITLHYTECLKGYESFIS
jgi:hypothetical protein